MSQLGYRVEKDVSYEGANISKSLNKDLESITYRDNLNSADEITLSIWDKEKKWIDAWFPLKGDKIQVKLIEVENEKRTSFDCGDFFVDDKKFTGFPLKLELKGTSIDIISKFKSETKTKIWSKTTLQKIGETIAKENKLKLSFQGQNVNIIQAEQKEQSNGGFLQQMCISNGFGMKIIKSNLVLFELSNIESKESTLTIIPKVPKAPNKLDSNTLVCKPDFDITDTDNDTYDECVIEYKDTHLGCKIKGYASVKRGGYKQGTGKVLKFNKSFGVKGTKEEKISQLNRIAASKLREKNQEEITCSFSFKGNFNICAGRTFKINGFGQYDSGTWVIISAEHRIDNNGFTTSLEGRKCLSL